MANLGINFSSLLYDPAMDMFSVDVVFNPVTSQPGQPTFAGRGIFSTIDTDIIGENNSIYSDQRTILDIRDAEFAIMPLQGDRVTIPRDSCGVNQGEWEIIDTDGNGGGETKLTIRRWEGP